MASVMGLLEIREAAARVRVDELGVEADRVLAELGDAEVVLERRVVVLAELAEALAAPEPEPEKPLRPVPVPTVVKVPGRGRWCPSGGRA